METTFLFLPIPNVMCCFFTLTGKVITWLLSGRDLPCLRMGRSLYHALWLYLCNDNNPFSQRLLVFRSTCLPEGKEAAVERHLAQQVFRMAGALSAEPSTGPPPLFFSLASIVPWLVPGEGWGPDCTKDGAGPLLGRDCLVPTSCPVQGICGRGGVGV